MIVYEASEAKLRKLLRATIATEFMSVVMSGDETAISKGVHVLDRPVNVIFNSKYRPEVIVPDYFDHQDEIDAKFLKTANGMNKLIGLELPMADAKTICGLLGKKWGGHVGLRPYKDTNRGWWSEEGQGSLQMVVAFSPYKSEHLIVTGYSTPYQHLFQSRPKEFNAA